MDLASAFSIYRIKDNRFSRDELDRGFKKLVKKYHPDKNQAQAEWCHLRMTEINEAYEVLMAHIENRSYQGQEEKGQDPSPPPRKEEKRNSSDSTFFQKASALFFEGVHTYYDYELTKRSLRQEGVWRYHYRRAIRLMDKALKEMEKRISPTNRDQGWEKLIYFGELFLSDIQAFEPNIPLSLRGGETHVAYSEAAASMDKAFGGYFSAEPEKRENYLSPLYRASHLLILLVENYPQTEWYNLALQKLNLLDSFLELQDLIRAGKIIF
ncbi:MAG: DnaJ domain-containing protein [Spirochaetales bacterium]|nr:DnaJ domain-containing protein [Spirochaetales bacterium]